MKDLIIIGAGGCARSTAWLVERINKYEDTWNLLGFVDDNKEIHGTTVNSYKVLGGCDCLKQYADAFVVCALGASKTRKLVVDKIKAMNPQTKFATLIDPTVDMSNLVSIGEGSVICAHTIMTVNIEIGEHVLINLDCTIGHDDVLGNFVTAYPGVNIAGNTSVGECTELGTGTQIIQGIAIGANSIVGAGSVVVRDIPNNCTAVGCPAKPIKFFE